METNKQKMKIKEKEFEGRIILYQLDGWDKDDWLNANDFLRELIDNGYDVTPNDLDDKTKININEKMENKKWKVLAYDDDLKNIDIIEVEDASVSSEELSDYDNYFVLDKNLQEQLKEAVKKMLGEN